MNDDLPEIFDRLQVLRAPAALRARVLSAVENELVPRKKPRWERALEVGVAACLAVGIGLNAYQWRLDSTWNGHGDSSRSAVADLDDLTEAVASVTGAEAARLIVASYFSEETRARLNNL
jgi:hypothetical protein